MLGRPHDVSAPEVLEELTGLRPGLDSGSVMSPHVRGNRYTSAGPLLGHPRDVSAPGVLEGLTGLRPGLETGSGLSPHMRGHTFNEGDAKIKG